MRGALRATGLALIGLSLVLPLALLSVVVVAAEQQVTSRASAAQQSETAAPYAQTFAMTILEEQRTIDLWLVDLDTEPFFRQTITVGGTVVSAQIYRFDERALYTSDNGSPDAPAWSVLSPVEPEALGLPDLSAGPAQWAAQFGAGEQQIPLADGTTVNVVIHAVDDPIDPAIFTLPPDAVVTPAGP